MPVLGLDAVPAKHGLVVCLTLTLCGTRGEEKFDLGNSTELAVEEVDRCRSLKGFWFFLFVLESAWRLIRVSFVTTLYYS